MQNVNQSKSIRTTFVSTPPDSTLTICPTAPERSTERCIVVCEIEDVLRQIGGLNNAPNFNGPFILNQHPNGVKQLGRELAVPPVLPGNQSDGGRHRLPRILVLLKDPEDTRESLRAESNTQACPIGFDSLVGVLKTLCQAAENLPLLGRLLVLHALGTILGHLCAPDRIHAKILVQNHEDTIKPAFAQALVVEA